MTDTNVTLFLSNKSTISAKSGNEFDNFINHHTIYFPDFDILKLVL
ncbi:hypothetical protein [Wolbachia endosymbiont of Cantharis cryptica]